MTTSMHYSKHDECHKTAPAGDKGTFEVKQEELKNRVLVPGVTGPHTATQAV